MCAGVNFIPAEIVNLRQPRPSNERWNGFIENQPGRNHVFISIMRGCEPSMEDQVLFQIHHAPHTVLVRCSGRIVRGDGADELFRAVMSQAGRDVEIDLSAVNAIDAGGLGVLAGLERWARETNRSIRLINPSRRVREALEATSLSSVLQVRPATAPKSRHKAA